MFFYGLRSTQFS